MLPCMPEGSIVIIGGGIAGVATAWWLARAGATVTLVEKESSLGLHSSGRNAAILRTAIAAWPTQELARETARFLQEPPAGFSEVALVENTGLILVEDERGGRPAWAADLAERDDARLLSADELAALAPHFRSRGGPAWHLAREGRIDISALLDGFARGTRAAGGRILSGNTVAELWTEGERVCGVHLEGGESIAADHTVIAAGGWAQSLGRAAGSEVQMRATRRHLMVTDVDASIDASWPIVWDDGAAFYCRPESGGMLLCACDQTDANPDEEVTDAVVLESIAAKTAKLLPQFADAGAAHFWSGVRTLTPDDRPIIGRDPEVAGLFWIAGLGGHGMSVSAGVGRLASELLLGTCSADERLAKALSPGRWAHA